MSKKKLPRRAPKSNLPSTEPVLPDTSETAPAESEQIAAKPPDISAGAIPQLKEGIAPVECLTPASLGVCRLTRLRALAESAIKIIIDDIVEVLVNQPGAAKYTSPVHELPDDVIHIVVASMHAAGWSVYLMDAKNIVIELPELPSITSDVIVTAPTSINPL